MWPVRATYGKGMKMNRGQYTLNVLGVVDGLVKVHLVEWCPDCGKRDEFTGYMGVGEVLDYKRHGACYCEGCAATRDEILYSTGY